MRRSGMMAILFGFVVIFIFSAKESFSADCNRAINDFNYLYPDEIGCVLDKTQIDTMLLYLIHNKGKNKLDTTSRQKSIRYVKILSKLLQNNQMTLPEFLAGIKKSEIEKMLRGYRDLEIDYENGLCAENNNDRFAIRMKKNELKKTLKDMKKKEIESAYESSIALCKNKSEIHSLLFTYKKLDADGQRNAKKYNKLFIDMMREDQIEFNYSIDWGSVNNEFVPAYYDFFTLVNHSYSSGNFTKQDLREISAEVIEKYAYLHDVSNEFSPIFYSEGIFDEGVARTATRSLLNLMLWSHQNGLEDEVKSLSVLLCKYDYLVYVPGMDSVYKSVYGYCIGN